MTSLHVRIHALTTLTNNRGNQWRVRWTVARTTFTKAFPTRALAAPFRTNLIAAADAGQAFGTDTGLPTVQEHSRDLTEPLHPQEQPTP